MGFRNFSLRWRCSPRCRRRDQGLRHVSCTKSALLYCFRPVLGEKQSQVSFKFSQKSE